MNICNRDYCLFVIYTRVRYKYNKTFKKHWILEREKGSTNYKFTVTVSSRTKTIIIYWQKLLLIFTLIYPITLTYNKLHLLIIGCITISFHLHVSSLRHPLNKRADLFIIYLKQTQKSESVARCIQISFQHIKINIISIYIK